jgi:CYTH domain-containing protein
MALEDILGEDTSGKAEQEIEHVFYGRIADPKQLDQLAGQPFVVKLLQEQSQGCLMPSGAGQRGPTIRVRRLNRQGVVMTTKKFVEGQAGMDETNLEATNEIYDMISKAIGTGIAKMRYTIKPDEYPKKLELDVFLDANGHPTGYAKFDYEVTSADETPPPLPLILTDLKHVNPFNASDADLALLREFMQNQSFQIH